MDRKGCQYHQAWPLAMRVWSAHGASVPAASPITMPEKAKTQVTKDPAQRPPR